jgi:hypothetical protein
MCAARGILSDRFHVERGKFIALMGRGDGIWDMQFIPCQQVYNSSHAGKSSAPRSGTKPRCGCICHRGIRRACVKSTSQLSQNGLLSVSYRNARSNLGTFCRLLSVLRLTPHMVWTVAVVTQHTRVMSSPLFLQERIRELCAKALCTPDPECQELLRELRNLLHEHSETLRKLAAEKLGNA